MDSLDYKIGSFNMYKFSYRSDNDIRKNLVKIADIIRQEQLDIVAIQEIFVEDAMNELIKKLGIDWEGRWDTPKSKSVSAAEGYAFIWNTRRISLVQNREGKIFEPRILNQYKLDKSFGQTKLIRNPYYARFTPNKLLTSGSFFEIRLINAHIMFSKSRGINENDNHDNSIVLGDIEMRRNEFSILSRAIYPKMSDKAYDLIMGEMDAYCMPVYTILLGDYNLNLKSSGKTPYISDEDANISLEDGKKRIVTVQEELTTLKGKGYYEEEEAQDYANNYDHFTYDEIRFDSVSVKVNVIPAVKRYYGNDFEMYRKEVSDHLPIVFSLNLKK